MLRSGKSEAYNNKTLRTSYYFVEANYWQT